MLKEKRKKAKKDTGKEDIEEDDPVKYKHAAYVMTCKLFADLERLKKEGEQKQAEAKKRKAAEEEEERERKRIQVEWEKNYEESRTERVTSWRDFKAKKSKHRDLRPPKPKPEKRDWDEETICCALDSLTWKNVFGVDPIAVAIRHV